jgi:hypothetical protein
MTRKVLFASVAAVAFGASVQFASAFPVTPMAAATHSHVAKVTFWAQPFPYRYNWSLVQACTHYETIETPRGPVMKRVWVCSVGRREAVVSYRN